MLKLRSCESVEARVVKGCPQGGVLSPLLLCMIVDNMLLKLNAMGHTAQAHADDLAIVIRGEYLGTVTDMMQGSLRVVDGWCKGPYTHENHMRTKRFANSLY